MRKSDLPLAGMARGRSTAGPDRCTIPDGNTTRHRRKYFFLFEVTFAALQHRRTVTYERVKKTQSHNVYFCLFVCMCVYMFMCVFVLPWSSDTAQSRLLGTKYISWSREQTITLWQLAHWRQQRWVVPKFKHLSATMTVGDAASNLSGPGFSSLRSVWLAAAPFFPYRTHLVVSGDREK